MSIAQFKGDKKNYGRLMMVGLLVLLLLNVNYTPTVAQETAKATTDSVVQLKPVPTADIPTESQKLTIRLREIEKKFGRQVLNDELDSLFVPLANDIDSLHEQYVELDLNTLSLRELDDMTNQWTRLGKELDDLEEQLKEQATQIESVLTELSGYQELWELTLKTAREEKQTKSPVYPTILEALKSISDRRNQVIRLRARNLEEQSLLLDKELHITESNDQLQDQIVASQKQLLVKNAPPLYTVLFGSDSLARDSLQLKADLKRSWEVNGTVILSYTEDNYNEHIFNLVVILILTILLYYLKRRSKVWAEHHADAMQLPARVIHRPIAVAVMLTLIFISQYVYENEPSAWRNAMFIVLVFPVFFVFPPLIHSRYHKPCYVLLVLFISVRLFKLIIEESLTSRLFLLFLTIAALALSVWFLVIYSKTPWYVRKRIFGAIFGFLFGLLFFVSIIGNLIGFITLSELLTVASLDSLGGSIILFTTYQILVGVLKMISLSRAFENWKTFADSYEVIMRFIFNMMSLAFVIWWLDFSLRQFQVYDNVVGWLDTLIFNKRSFGTIEMSVANFLGFFLVIWISHYISKIIRALLQNDILSKMKLPRGVPGAISIITRYSILTLGILLAFGVLGIELSELTFLVGALGVGIGFGLQNIFNNLVSGLILAFERPVQVGDTIQLGQLFGSVKEIGIRSSTVRAFTGAEVIVPNGNLISNEVVNWTLSDKKRRIELDVGVEYGSNPHVVIALLEKVANDHQEVLTDPPPQAVFLDFGESSLDFKLYYWLTNLDLLFTIKSEMYLGVYDALNGANITIPFPQRDLYLKTVPGQLSEEFIKENGLKVKEAPSKEEEKPKSASSKRKPRASTAKRANQNLPDEGSEAADDGGEH